MSVSTISSNFGYSHAAGGHPPRKQEIDALSEALQSGDISSAQQAFGALFNANSNQTANSSSGSNSNSGNDVVADISALGKALASGDLTSAQSAFSSLQEDIQNAPPPPPPPGQNGAMGGDANADSVQSLFDQLATALQAGDIDAAQTAFDSLQELAPSEQANSTNSADPFSNDIAALSSALSSGDISSAQSAFAQLQEDLQNAPPPPPGGPNGVGDPGGPGGKDDPVQQAFSDLASALESNDIEAAKTAFATLQSLAPDNQNSTSDSSSTTASTSTTDTIGTDLSSLSDALEAGDLTSAQSLFETLLADLQANAPRHPGVDRYAQNRSDTTASSTSVSVTA